jgi:peroxiredoxin Q/BCP
MFRQAAVFRTFILAALLAPIAATVAAGTETAAPVPAAADGQRPAATDFRLQDQKGIWHTLAQYRGRWVVLYFYPKDFTPGCTTQVCTFRDDIVALHKAGAEVLGVSLDDVKSHAEFAAKYHVPFPLLSDATAGVARAYGVLTERNGMRYARRETFLIDPEGRVARHYPDVDPKENSGQVLADLALLKAAP